jgi:CRP-like cAMP-binding protein
MHGAVIRKIETFIALSDEEKQVLLSAIGSSRDIDADRDIVSEGDRPRHCAVILEGLACRYKILEDGRRQIMSFQIAGDMCDLHSFLVSEMDHSIGTLTPCKVAHIPHETVLEIMQRYPRIAHALWRDTVIDAAIFREWMVGIGRRPAASRIAHLLCEVFVRLRAVGLAADHRFEFPVTQLEVGDALGLSLVHVNRSLQVLRGDGLITWRGKTLVIADWQGLQQVAEFEPKYLHLDDGQETNGKLNSAWQLPSSRPGERSSSTPSS